MARVVRDGGGGVAVGVGLVVAMVLLVALAVGAHRSGLILLLLLAVAAAVVAARATLPEAPLLWITFGICTPLYSAIYATVLATLFRHVSPVTAFTAYVLPLAAFNATLVWRRADIATRLSRPRAEHGPTLARGLAWLALSAAVGAVARAAVPPDPSAAVQNLALLLTMAALAVLVVLFAPDITLLLTETGLLFRTFTGRMAQRVVPVFSFVVVFTFVVVVFAALYAILDRFASAANFSVAGNSRAMTFPEALYFSFITLSTIGYGDITPVTGVARLLVVGEIIFGVVLMLFAFAEIAAYNPEAPERGPDDRQGSE